MTDAPAAHILALDGLGKGSAPLDGPWQFHLGDDPSYASPTLDDTTGHNGWEQLTADKPWGMQGHEGYTGYAWYRRHIAITTAPGAAPDIALLLYSVQDVCEIYWNGLLIGRVGKFPPQPVWYYRPPIRTFGLGPIGLAPENTGVLAFRFWHAPPGSFQSGNTGGFTATPILGSPIAIATLKETSDFRWLRAHQLRFGLSSLGALVALLGFVGWLRDRRQWLLFWMGCYALGAVVIDLPTGLRLTLPFTTLLGLQQPFFGVVSIATFYVLILLLHLNHNRRLMWIVRWVAIVEMSFFVLDAVVVLIIPYVPLSRAAIIQWSDAILTAGFTPLQATPLFLVAYAVWRRQRLAPERWLVAFAAFFADGIPTLASAFDQGSRFTHWTVSNHIRAPLFFLNGNPVNAQLLSQTVLLLAVIYAVYRFNEDERRRQARLEQEFQNARELQQVLIPEDIPEIPGFTLTTAYKPAQEVGGDFFQIIPLLDHSALIVLGDVSGKGLKAAMTVSLLVGAIRTALELTSEPAAILAILNRRLHGRMQDGFATCIALRLNPNGSCLVASAGHPAPFLNQRELDLPGALPLGLIDNATYEETTIQLQHGDHFSLYTDGLLEARNATGELYGFERLNILFAARPDATQATEAAVAFGQDDDITVLTLTRLATA
ncbi:MAG TPA: PP2C family protein-serine/threonine phosphatase [Acidobacteriaceae bacterium]|nr:PP2C family protein-serine/threonine phosphatase [Acidobacteriaceae bacterium]